MPPRAATPESAATVAALLNEYALIAPWDVSTRQTNEGFIRRTITRPGPAAARRAARPRVPPRLIYGRGDLAPPAVPAGVVSLSARHAVGTEATGPSGPPAAAVKGQD
jgi:hypothetical protein